MPSIKTLLLAALIPAVMSCAAALPIIAAAVPIAERALDWIFQIERHVAPLVASVDASTAQRIRDALPAARAAAVAAKTCGKQASGDGSAVDCADALVILERELSALIEAGRPFGIVQSLQLGLLGESSDGIRRLGVPSACEIVRGTEGCGPSTVPPTGAP